MLFYVLLQFLKVFTPVWSLRVVKLKHGSSSSLLFNAFSLISYLLVMYSASLFKFRRMKASAKWMNVNALVLLFLCSVQCWLCGAAFLSSLLWKICFAMFKPGPAPSVFSQIIYCNNASGFSHIYSIFIVLNLFFLIVMLKDAKDFKVIIKQWGSEFRWNILSDMKMRTYV